MSEDKLHAVAREFLDFVYKEKAPKVSHTELYNLYFGDGMSYCADKFLEILEKHNVTLEGSMTYEQNKLPWPKSYADSTEFPPKLSGNNEPGPYWGHANEEKQWINGRFVPESQAIALFRGTKMILEVIDPYLSYLQKSDHEPIFEAISLLRKGIGDE